MRQQIRNLASQSKLNPSNATIWLAAWQHARRRRQGRQRLPDADGRKPTRQELAAG